MDEFDLIREQIEESLNNDLIIVLGRLTILETEKEEILTSLRKISTRINSHPVLLSDQAQTMKIMSLRITALEYDTRTLVRRLDKLENKGFFRRLFNG